MSEGSLQDRSRGAGWGRQSVGTAVLAWPARDALVLTALLVLGLALRLEDLQLLPKQTDEMRDAIFSLPIARGESFPLANFSSYDGALFNYLQAALFRVAGTDPRLPRLQMLVFGLLVLPVVYLLGRRLAGSAVGLIAAALLAVSPVHVLVNSRIAWGNSLTPLLSTAAFWLVARAAQRPAAGRPDPAWSLLPAGLLLGLALQTHPTVFVLLPGAALALLLTRPELPRGRWPWLALLGLALGYANMLAFNALNDLESIRFAQHTRANYALTDPDAAWSYPANLGDLLLGLFRMLGGAVEDRAGQLDFLLDSSLLLVSLTIAVGLVWSVRRMLLPALVTLSVVLLLPAFNDRYEPITDGRYLAPLLPLLSVAAASLLVDLWLAGSGRWRAAARGLAVAGLAALLVVPLVGLQRYHEQHEAAARRSARLWAALELARRSLPPDSAVILDRDLEHARLGAGSTELLWFEYGALMQGLRFQVIRVTPGNLADALELDRQGEQRLVVMERGKALKIGQHFALRSVDQHLDERGVQEFAAGVYLVANGRPGRERARDSASPTNRISGN